MRNLTLLTDLYQLTMGYGFYRHQKHEEEVVFDLFFRKNSLKSTHFGIALWRKKV